MFNPSAASEQGSGIPGISSMGDNSSVHGTALVLCGLGLPGLLGKREQWFANLT